MMMELRRTIFVAVILTGLQGLFLVPTAGAQETPAVGEQEKQASSAEESQPEDAQDAGGSSMSEGQDDPDALLLEVQQRRTEWNSVFPASPFKSMHEASDRRKQKFYEKTHIKLGGSFSHLFQWISESPLGDDDWATNSNLDAFGTWEIANRGKPNQGQLFIHFQGRWDYGTPGPEVLATYNLGSLNGTANTYSAYIPTFIMRNLYWQQGSEQAGWAYRLGKMTPDATLASSAHFNAATAFMPTVAFPFSIALTDSGLGAAATWYVNDRFKILGLVSDANADRFNMGDITEGDFFSAIEFATKIAPRTAKAGYSKLTVWHTDETKDGQAVNGHLGPEGWGFFIKHEQELSDDGRAIGILRYGKSYNGTAVYDKQILAHFLLYDPANVGRLQNDLLGVGVSWAQANVDGARAETNVEIFYRFPIFPQVDMTLSYQALINLALDPDNDYASAFGLRLRTTF
jgi:porin